MTIDNVRELITDYILDDDEANKVIIFENPDYADAFIGLTTENNAVYDYDKMVKYLVEKDSISEEEAIEFIDYNTIRAIQYFNTEGRAPIIVNRLTSLGD